MTTKKTYYPLTSPQREIWFDQMLHPQVPLYNVGGYVQINGAIDSAIFERAVNLLVQRHDALRTVLVLPGTSELPMQTALKDLPVTVLVHDFSKENNPRQSALAFMQQQFVQPFDLYEKPLFHFALLKIDDNGFFGFVKSHHLIVDGWSFSLITQSVAKIYTQLIQGQFCERVAPSYFAFVKNDRAYLESDRYEVHRQYWIEKYQTLPEPLLAPRYLSRFVNQIPPSERRVLSLARPFYNQLIELATSFQATTFHLILAALYVYFTRTVQTEELVVGLPVLNRPCASFKNTIGLFVGISAARFTFGTDLSFKTLLQSIGRELKQNYRCQRFPISELNREVGLHKIGRKLLFDVSVSYEKHDYDALFGPYQAQATTLVHGYEQTPFMIYVREFHDDQDVDIDFVYNLAYFEAAEIERIQSRFLLILEYVLNHPEESIRTIPLLTEAEQQQLLAWNQTQTDYPIEQTIVDLFQAQVEKTPDNIAVVFEQQQLSYQELNINANQLAHHLMTLGVSAETLVGICVERSLEMVIGLLGILKAGGAYVPLDPDYPPERLQFMLEDSNVPVLLGQSHLRERLPASTAFVICLDSDWATIAAYSGENMGSQSGPSNLAYVISTSGSTGMPKGVMVEHSALVNFLSDMQQRVKLTPTDKLLAITTLSFDIAALELYLPLISGSQTIIISRETANNGEALIQKLTEYQITIMQATPATWKLLIQTGWHNITPLTILCGGEALPNPLGQTLLKNSQQLWNVYGPTETTIWSSIHDVTQYQAQPELVGRPIANTQIYILDTHHNPTPLGIPGELCIAGRGLARGYLNRSELTKEKFIDIELFGKTQRIYQTGDLARWLPDGNLEYLGRLDHQIKLRGFRIELGEIEATLSQHEAVKEAIVVLYDKENNPQLIAYVTLTLPIDEVESVLRSWLKTRLPEYMVPGSFTVLDKLPLTPNGKIDRQALPAPDLSNQTVGPVPQTETEQLLCNLWSQVLGIEITSRQSHFFESSGHSLLATQLVSRIRDSFGIEMPLRIIFERPILQEQANWLDSEQRGSELPPITPRTKGEPAVLSFAQQRLWFLDQLEGQSATYHMPAALHLEGQLHETALQHALTALIQRHDSLRSGFPVVDGEAQVQLNDVYNPLSITDLSQLSKTEQPSQVTEWIINHAQTPFNLSTGPLLRLRLLKLDQQEQILLFNMHHIISDGWSMAVLIRDWSQLYNAYAQNQEPHPTAKRPIQYTDYAVWQQNWLQGDVLAEQLAYWIEKLTKAPELLELPTDYPRPAVMRYQGKQLPSTLAPEFTRRIKQLSQQYGVTVFMTLLSAFKVLLFRYSGQTDLIVGSPIANRTHHQTEALIGFFVNTLVLRTHLKGTSTFSTLLTQVRQTALEAYSHQDIPFEYLVEQLNPSRRLSHSPLFQVMFVLQNAPSAALELSGLTMSFLKPEQTTTKFDLTLSVEEHGDVLVCKWKYNTDLFRPDTIIRMTEHFQVLLEGILNNPEQSLDQLPLLTEAEQQQLLAWNQTQTDYPIEQTLVDLFQAQVEKTPDTIAVVFEQQALRYRVLNTKANQLAHQLMTLGVRAETLVGICVERSLEMVIGLLGILKAGGAYVPIDPDYPPERLQFMLKESSVPVLLTQSHLLARLPATTAKVVCLDSDWEQIATGLGTNPVRQSGPKNLAYVIYTSGSTGKPKGAGVFHHGLTNLVNWYVTELKLTAQDSTLIISPFSFDLTQKNFFAPLILGGQVHLLPSAYYDPDTITQQIADNTITWINCAPSAFYPLTEANDDSRFLKSLRYAVLGGEPISLPRLWSWLAADSCQAQLINSYGPTECTDVCVAYWLDQPSLDKTIPIGRPIYNVQLVVLDEYQALLPVGVAGELYIGGECVGAGYLNDVEMTQAKFIPNPFNNDSSRLYKTGDLVRYLPDGNLEYLGRLDHQVKLRGFRIELGEIEATLSQHEAVQEAVAVLYDEKDNPQLVAYVTNAMPIDEVGSILRSWLKTRLPEYMVPASFTVLDKLPLTPNGKIDRKALPVPDLSSQTVGQLPQTETEQLLCNLWSQVLGIEVTSTQSHFFETGGHSLLATQLVSRIRESFGIEMPLRIIFERPILQEQAKWLDSEQRDSELPPITPRTEGEPIVLSFAQQRLWFLAQLEESSATYNMPAALHLTGQLNETALQRAFITLIQRHDNLRSGFPVVDGEAQAQLNDVYNPLSITDLSQLSKTEQPSQVTEWISNHAQTPFELNTGPLLSLRLLKLDQQEQILLFNMHHIISDGWSMGVLIRSFCQFYNAYAQNQEPHTAPNLPIQYTDYAAWQRNWLQGDVLAEQLAYWIEKLTKTPELLELPTDYPRPAVMRYQGKHLPSTLPPELTRKIKQLSQQYSVTVFMTLLSAFKVLLFRYSGQTDLVVGCPIANRTHHQTEELIGLFVNTLVLRTHIKGTPTFSVLLTQVRQTALEAYSHQDIPFEYLVEQLNPPRRLSHSPLFQVMFDLQTAPEEALKLSGLTMSLLESDNTTTKFDLTLSVAEKGDVFVCDWEYNTDLFRPDTIIRMTEHFQVLLEGILNNPEQSLDQLPLLTEAEQQQLLAWNQTQTDYPIEQTIVDLFQAQVDNTPDTIAVVFEQQQLSYRALNTKANQLAHHLMTLGVTAETLVGICVERSLAMVIGLLGILKAGGAYVPMDPEYPPQRLQFILEDSSVPVLLSQSHLLERLPVSTAKVVSLDSDWEQIAAGSEENPVIQSGPANLAYVIYTSGSTGVPKGVMVQHTALSNFNNSSIKTYSISKEDSILQFASINFDAAVEEIYPILTQGGRLILRDKNMLDTDQTFLQTCQQKGITLLDLPTAYWQQLISTPDNQNYWPESVRLVIIGGEAASIQHVKHWQQTVAKNVQLLNTYGPTEATVVASSYRLTESIDKFPIGKPISNTQIYILDTYHNPTPLGIPGELCIAGRGLARGYLNRPELTKEKFIDIELFGKQQRIYQTGDLARWLPDGNLEYLGRLDHQVKLRCFRIELGEIEAVLGQHPAVRENVVIVQEEDNTGKRLVAFIVPQEGSVFETTNLRTFLTDRLPAYMIPSAFVTLDDIPLTPNGKIDRRVLQRTEIAYHVSEQSLVPPRTPTEELLAGIWRDVLKLERIGIHQNFFEMGGHSLLATRVISRIRETFSVELPLRHLFESPTVAELAKHILNARHDEQLPPIIPINREQPLPLSFAQQRLWFLDNVEGINATYNMAAALRLEGTLHNHALEQSLQAIVQRHETLRTTFSAINGKPISVISEPLSVNTARLAVIDLPELPQPRFEAQRLINQEALRPFDLSEGSLFRATLLQLGVDSYVLMVNLHHIISDGWSIALFVHELSTLYKAFSQRQPSSLPALPIQYVDFAHWQQQWLTGKVLKNHLNYWKQQLAGIPPVLEIPTDRPRPPVQQFQGNTESFLINHQLTQQLTALSQQSGTTLFMTLLAAFVTLLYRYSSQEDIVVGSPIANRTRSEIEGLIGFFANTLALRIDISGNPTFIELLARLRKTTMAAYAYQDLPFEKLVEELQPVRNPSYNPIFQIMFALQNIPTEKLDLPGLSIIPLKSDTQAALVDLFLSLQESEEGLNGFFMYSTALFDAATITRLIGYFQTLLAGIVANPQQQVAKLPLLTKDEQQRMLAHSSENTPMAVSDNEEPNLAQLDELSDEEVEALLNKMLTSN